jgi:hypothetical protein
MTVPLTPNEPFAIITEPLYVVLLEKVMFPDSGVLLKLIDPLLNSTFDVLTTKVLPVIVVLPVGSIETVVVVILRLEVEEFAVTVSTLLTPLVTARFACIFSTPLEDTFPPTRVLATYTNSAPK